MLDPFPSMGLVDWTITRYFSKVEYPDRSGVYLQFLCTAPTLPASGSVFAAYFQPTLQLH